MEQQFDTNDLIIRFLEGRTSSEENNRLEEWKNASKENEEHFNAMRNIWLISLSAPTTTKSGQSEDIDELKTEYKKLHKRIQPFTFKMYFKPLVVAASIILALFIGTKINSVVPESSFLTQNDSLRFESVKGSISIITLPDGSKIWLNSNTDIAYSNSSYNKEERVIELDGEAFFDVVTDPEKPFIVKTKGIEVKATGTSFNVRAYSEDPDVTTTLVEGILHIEGVDKNNHPFNMEVQPNQTITYFPEENLTKEDLDFLPVHALPSQSTLNAQSIPAVKMENIDTKVFTSWKDKRWMIENDKFAVLKNKLERRFNVVFVLEDEAVKEYRFSGSFETETIGEVMQILKHTIPIDYRIEKGIISVKTDKRAKLIFDKATR